MIDLQTNHRKSHQVSLNGGDMSWDVTRYSRIQTIKTSGVDKRGKGPKHSLPASKTWYILDNWSFRVHALPAFTPTLPKSYQQSKWRLRVSSSTYRNHPGSEIGGGKGLSSAEKKFNPHWWIGPSCQKRRSRSCQGGRVTHQLRGKAQIHWSSSIVRTVWL